MQISSKNKGIDYIRNCIPEPLHIVFDGVLLGLVAKHIYAVGKKLIAEGKKGDKNSDLVGKGCMLLSSSLVLFLSREILQKTPLETAANVANYTAQVGLVIGIATASLGILGSLTK